VCALGEDGAGHGGERVRGGENVGECAVRELPAHQSLGRGVGEADDTAGTQEDHRCLELSGTFGAGAPVGFGTAL
jgi:hypothetical protein